MIKPVKSEDKRFKIKNQFKFDDEKNKDRGDKIVENVLPNKKLSYLCNLLVRFYLTFAYRSKRPFLAVSR